MTTRVAAACPRCGSDRTTEVPCADGPHHARLECSGCGRFLKFLPKPEVAPGPVRGDLVALCCERVTPARLRGTDAQVRAAESIRARMLDEVRRAGGSGRVLILKAVADASWFLANRDRPIGLIRWPSESQLAGELPADVDPPAGWPEQVGRSATPKDLSAPIPGGSRA